MPRIARPLRERIADLSMPEPNSGCWLWLKRVDRGGYACITLGKNYTKNAHRVSYQVFKGPIPDGMLVCHRCDVRSCVNPDHLWVGTDKENSEDAAKKNRTARGLMLPQTMLNARDIPSIRALLSKGEKLAKIARKFGVSPDTIACIRDGKNWKHVA